MWKTFYFYLGLCEKKVWHGTAFVRSFGRSFFLSFIQPFIHSFIHSLLTFAERNNSNRYLRFLPYFHRLFDVAVVVDVFFCSFIQLSCCWTWEFPQCQMLDFVRRQRFPISMREMASESSVSTRFVRMCKWMFFSRCCFCSVFFSLFVFFCQSITSVTAQTQTFFPLQCPATC